MQLAEIKTAYRQDRAIGVSTIAMACISLVITVLSLAYIPTLWARWVTSVLTLAVFALALYSGSRDLVEKWRLSQTIGEHDSILVRSPPPDGDVASWKLAERDFAEKTEASLAPRG